MQRLVMQEHCPGKDWYMVCDLFSFSKANNQEYPYENHLSRSFFLLTIGRVTTSPIANSKIANTSWILLNPSLNTSNVPDGDTRVRNMSSPYAYTSDVDSSSAGLVMIFAVSVIYGASVSITRSAST